MFRNRPSSSNRRATSRDGSKQCWFVSISAASPLQERGEHSALLPAEKVTTSKPSRCFSIGATTRVGKDGSGAKGFHRPYNPRGIEKPVPVMPPVADVVREVLRNAVAYRVDVDYAPGTRPVPSGTDSLRHVSSWNQITLGKHCPYSCRRTNVVSAVFLSISSRTSQYSVFSSTGVGSSAQLQPAIMPV